MSNYSLYAAMCFMKTFSRIFQVFLAFSHLYPLLLFLFPSIALRLLLFLCSTCIYDFFSICINSSTHSWGKKSDICLSESDSFSLTQWPPLVPMSPQIHSSLWLNEVPLWYCLVWAVQQWTYVHKHVRDMSALGLYQSLTGWSEKLHF